MKKYFLFLILLPASLGAQHSMKGYYQLNRLMFDSDLTAFEESFAPLKLREKLQISGMHVETVYGKGKKYTSEKSFNHKGRLLHSSDKYHTADYTYEADSLVTSETRKRGRNTYQTRSSYTDGKMTVRQKYEKEKLQSTTLVAYNPQDKISNSQIIGKKHYEMQYIYNDAGKMKKCIYLINGRKNKEWIYECKEEGEILASKTEAISSFCTYREESRDGSYTVFTRILKEGKPYLVKQVYTKDSVQVLYQQFLKDSILISEMKKEGNTETSSSYKESGKKLYKQVVSYDDAGSVIAREYFQGKKETGFSKTTFVLNADGTTKTRQFFRKGKLKSTANFTYSFF